MNLTKNTGSGAIAGRNGLFAFPVASIGRMCLAIKSSANHYFAHDFTMFGRSQHNDMKTLLLLILSCASAMASDTSDMLPH